jgi:hypothetical protein
MFESWCKDIEERNEFARTNSIFLGSFYNPEAAKKMVEKNQYETTDEEFESTSMQLLEEIKQEESLGRKKRKRKLIK